MALPNPAETVAVLVGVSQYPLDDDLGNLPSVARNLRDLRDALTDQRFGGLDPQRCLSVLNPRMPADVAEPLLESTKRATDTLLFYFAGHGLRDDNGRLYLSTRLSKRGTLSFSSVAFD